MRATTWLLTAILLAACRPSATVEQTTPVANLQSYRSVALRVKSSAFASQGIAMFLEQATLNKLREKCGFEQVGPVTGAPSDVVLDLNITHSGRGGGGWVNNSGTATIDTLLVLSDGINGDLLGTARIRGKSSGMIVNNRPPENEAVEVIAKTIADTLAKSGCAGPRIARAPEPPPPDTGSATTTTQTGSAGDPATGSAGTPPIDDKRRAEAEALNETGKEKLRSADIQGALGDFQRAVSLVPDPRYQYNICLTLEALEQFDNAIAACKQARAMNPEPRLVSKIDNRLGLLAKH
ncbi:MAG TPA: tetratricopeptide repeat protein [Kofleriaceae bacterium]